jgi:hypothetical protein
MGSHLKQTIIDEVRTVSALQAMAGVPANIALDSNWSAQCQAAALMFASTGDISHDPPARQVDALACLSQTWFVTMLTCCKDMKKRRQGHVALQLCSLSFCPAISPSSWACWTQDGNVSAHNSNVALGSQGPAAVDSFIQDASSTNAGVGHRRWLLYPWTQRMGVGSVDYFNAAARTAGATIIWVLDYDSWVAADGYQAPRPATRDDWVAWPPPGYVPYQASGPLFLIGG